MGKGLLRYSDVRLIVASVGLSALGDFLAFVPLALQLEQTTDSPLAVSALLIALWGPVVALSPVAGLIVDRFETRRVLVAVSAAQAAVAAVLAFQADSTAAILALSTLLGIGFAVAQPAEFALVPALVPEERLNEANGLVETARYTGMIVGPLIGSLLAGAGGMQIALLANAATFVGVAIAGFRLRVRRPPRPRTHEGAADRARDGFVHLFEDRVLATVLVVAVVSLVFMTTSWTAEVFFIRDVLGAGDFGYGLLFATWGLGMVLGGLVVSRRIRGATLATAALVAVLVQGAGLGLPTLWLVLPFAIALAFVGGVGHGLKNVLVRTLIQQRVPDRLHGRAAAAYNGLRNGAELIALGSGGLLVAGVGPRATLALAGGIPILAALAGLAMRRRSLTERRHGHPVRVPGDGTIATASAE
jgi:MFS family permease